MTDQAQLLRRLAGQCDDLLLEQCFPELSPDQTRQGLLRLSERLAARAAKPQQASLLPPDTPRKATPAPAAGIETMRLFADGASRGNPGQAAAGFHLQDGQGNELVAKGHYLGQCTNNVAEYKALILGLQEAAAFKPRSLTIHLDSELVVKQIKGLYKVKNPGLKPLFDQAKALLTGFGRYTIRHIPRAENSRADQLANQAIDNRG